MCNKEFDSRNGNWNIIFTLKPPSIVIQAANINPLLETLKQIVQWIQRNFY